MPNEEDDVVEFAGTGPEGEPEETAYIEHECPECNTIYDCPDPGICKLPKVFVCGDCLHTEYALGVRK